VALRNAELRPTSSIGAHAGSARGGRGVDTTALARSLPDVAPPHGGVEPNRKRHGADRMTYAPGWISLRAEGIVGAEDDR